MKDNMWLQGLGYPMWQFVVTQENLDALAEEAAQHTLTLERLIELAPAAVLRNDKDSKNVAMEPTLHSFGCKHKTELGQANVYHKV